MRGIIFLAALSSLQFAVASPLARSNDHAPAVRPGGPKVVPVVETRPNPQTEHERAKPIAARASRKKGSSKDTGSDSPAPSKTTNKDKNTGDDTSMPSKSKTPSSSKAADDDDTKSKAPKATDSSKDGSSIGGLVPVPAGTKATGGSGSSGKRFKFPKLPWPRKKKETTIKIKLRIKGPRMRFPKPKSNSTAPANNASCPIDVLAPQTWNRLQLDTWLNDWVKANVTAKETNNVQELATTFGAPNFGCGVDQFCDAGQPCAPVKTPEWYALLATQNLNTYMNAVLQGSEVANNILNEILPAMVTDLYPQGDTSTVLTQDLYTLYNTVLSAIYFITPPTTQTSTEQPGTAENQTAITNTQFVLEALQPTIPEGETTAWTNLTTHLPVVMEDYMDQISMTLQDIIDKPIDEVDGGLAAVLKGGAFLGTAQDFTQEELSSATGPSMQVYAAALMLRSQGFQLSVANQTSNNAGSCKDKDVAIGSSSVCVDNGPQDWTMSTLVDKNFYPQNGIMDVLVSKYGLTREQITHEALACDPNADYFGGMLPLDPKTQCLFVLPAMGINI
ncbi:hypothetical protein BROUX41_000879 [Berkeleyomyces rouxiae]